jgi:hypothetical protein
MSLSAWQTHLPETKLNRALTYFANDISRLGSTWFHCWLCGSVFTTGERFW